jgi:hypothetical protein
MESPAYLLNAVLSPQFANGGEAAAREVNMMDFR